MGGTGRDHLYGGYGDDLLNADDNLNTADGLNNSPDTDPPMKSSPRRADVMCSSHHGGDRLIMGGDSTATCARASYGMATITALSNRTSEYLMPSREHGAST